MVDTKAEQPSVKLMLVKETERYRSEHEFEIMLADVLDADDLVGERRANE